MADAGLSVWQTLPLVIPDTHGSPYQSPSAFAGNPHLLPSDDEPVASSDLDEFRTGQAPWLDDFALFAVLKRRFGEKPWVEWPSEYRYRSATALRRIRDEAQGEINAIVEEQFRFDRAWRRVRDHAGQLGITLFGDMPIFVAHDSADTWSRPEDFLLDDEGRSTYVAGVPPDYFAASGQRWGNPHYDWARMQSDHFAWWIKRMQREFEHFDLVRIDHFRGLVAVWMIAAACETAVDGHWQATPGDDLLATLQRHFPNLPIVAEDLGVITDEVHALRQKYGLSGMSILQFAFDHFADNPHKPANIEEQRIAYTGTHDNNTVVGWFNDLEQHDRDFVFQVLGVPPRDDIDRLLIETAMSSRAWLAMAPLQDYLGLGGNARMNTPGVSNGNWRWQFDWTQLDADLPSTIRKMVEDSGRLDGR